ncbi:MAG TPA: FHA domain-containing protein [Woeseiaceae bacterium]|nr:FHA domain-containing protein [Woeseiaceae bacterium]
MTRLAAHVNDAGITLLAADRILYREPGFAFLDGERLTTGNEAYAHARVHPRSIQHRYWRDLSADPLPDRRFAHLSPADLVSRQLEQMWAVAGGATELVFAVPAWMSQEQLGLLLGIAAELGLPVSAMVEAAVAATRREYVNAVPVHVDIGLHAATLSRLAQRDGEVRLERSEVIEDCGVWALYDAWLTAVAEAFVQQSRFDPLYDAETEQMLLAALPDWLAAAARGGTVALALEHRGLRHEAGIEALALIGAAAPHYQRIASRLRALYRAEDTPAIQVTDRVARLPGLADMLKARVGGEVFGLEPGATARGALARCREPLRQGAAVALRRRLPLDQAPVEVEQDRSAGAASGLPTHLLFGDIAYEINDLPLWLGSRPAEGERTIVLGGDMPGVSRRHCSVRRVNGQCVLEDTSRYGTFLNGHRIDGSTVLQVGDTVRVGSPGYEFRLITTDESHGA